ncbi:TAXI family TRAP transporter solute-binding subunit [Chloroflexota bacterium]
MSKKKAISMVLVAVLVTSIIASAALGCAAGPPAGREIRAFSAGKGSMSYVLTFALAEQINENSSWLRCTALEMPSGGAGLLRLSQDPETRKTSISVYGSIDDYAAMTGAGPFKDYPYTVDIMARYFASPWVIATNNPDIKTPQDLIDKRVAVGGSESASGSNLARVLFKMWGIEGKVKPIYLGYSEAGSALVSREVSAWVVPITGVELGKKYSTMPALTEAQQAVKLHWISFDRDQAADYFKKNGIPFFPHQIPPGTGGGNDVPVDGVIAFVGWGCDSEMDDDVVTEISRVIYENIENFWEYHAGAKAMTREALAGFPDAEKRLHKAALKFYKEKGVTIGFQGF